jgi:lipopolysaccharide export system permease protein
MPILWRYLLKDFLKTFSICCISFLWIILLMRAQEIARFATLSPSVKQTALFGVIQLPYIIPFGIPISCLIAAFAVSTHLNNSCELTSLRASGSSLFSIFSPIYFCSLFLSLLSFYIISEVTPSCKNLSKSLLYDSIGTSPMLIFKKKKFLNLRNSCMEINSGSEIESGKDFIFGYLDPSNHLLTLILAKKITANPSQVKMNDFSSITNGKENISGFNTLIIENQKSSTISTSTFLKLIKRDEKEESFEDLKMKPCILKWIHNSKKDKIKGSYEIFKRVYFLTLPFVFTLIGLHSGLRLSRVASSKSNLFLLGQILLIFISFFIAKSVHKNLFLSLIFFFAPSLIILFIHFWKSLRFERGVG